RWLSSAWKNRRSLLRAPQRSCRRSPSTGGSFARRRSSLVFPHARPQCGGCTPRALSNSRRQLTAPSRSALRKIGGHDAPSEGAPPQVAPCWETVELDRIGREVLIPHRTTSTAPQVRLVLLHRPP